MKTTLFTKTITALLVVWAFAVTSPGSMAAEDTIAISAKREVAEGSLR